MSDCIFPDLALGGEFARAPRFNTKILKSVNGRELRASYQAIPTYEITLQIPVIDEKAGDLKIIEDFFIARRGAFDSFLFKMPWDNEYDCTFIGDGLAQVFQLYKKSDEGIMPLGNTEAFETKDPLMWAVDLSKPMWTDLKAQMWDIQYNVSKNGVLTLPLPLAAGESITVKGNFYYRCRFADDSQAFTLFNYRLWKGEVTLIGSLGNKI